MIAKLLAGSLLAAGIAVSPISLQTASAHPPGPGQCWIYKHHHWKWICQRRVRPIYQPYYDYDPYLYSDPYPYSYQPYYYGGPTIGLYFGTGGGYHHHNNWDWKKH